MRCPFCQASDTRVLDSRDSAEGTVVRRRRVCKACKHRFTSYERVEVFNPLVVKKDDRREAFDREKVFAGLARACEKRPVPVEQLEELVTDIEHKLQALGEKEVPSSVIGEWLMERLSSLDEVAYVRFASVYRHFRDVTEFMNELKEIIRGGKNAKGRAKQ